MRTALAFWRRGPATATSSTLVLHRPAEINWLHIALKIALSFMLLGNLMAPFAARAQNLGTSPQFGQAVQGQQATTVEGTVLNIVNWSCNVIAPVIAVACLGIAGWHFKSGRGYMGWGVMVQLGRAHVWSQAAHVLGIPRTNPLQPDEQLRSRPSAAVDREDIRVLGAELL